MPSSLSSQLTIPRILTASAAFCACIIVGLFTSSFFRILPSIGIVGVLLCGLLAFILHGDSYTRSSRAIYLPFVLIYGIHAASGFLTSNANLREYERDIVLQLPFLALPIGFWLLPPIPTRQLRLLWYLLILVTVVSAVISTGNYLLHIDEINELYLRSKVMPTEPDHIRFSLIVTLAITAGAVLLGQSKMEPRTQILLRVVVIGLALYQHLLAVRSGLVTFYMLGGLALLWLVLNRKQYRRATSLASILVVLPLFSYLCFPTFRNKSANTREDVGRVEHTASANNYSLVGRVYSYKVALKVVENNPWFGVGKADMEQELARHYKREFPNIQPEAYILPHNQFLFTTVALGCVGVVLFIIGFYYPGITSGARYAPLLLSQYIIVTISFLVEYTIETQIGIAFSLFFLLLALEGAKRGNNESAEELWRPS